MGPGAVTRNTNHTATGPGDGDPSLTLGPHPATHAARANSDDWQSSTTLVPTQNHTNTAEQYSPLPDPCRPSTPNRIGASLPKVDAQFKDFNSTLHR